MEFEKINKKNELASDAQKKWSNKLIDLTGAKPKDLDLNTVTKADCSIIIEELEKLLKEQKASNNGFSNDFDSLKFQPAKSGMCQKLVRDDWTHKNKQADRDEFIRNVVSDYFLSIDCDLAIQAELAKRG